MVKCNGQFIDPFSLSDEQIPFTRYISPGRSHHMLISLFGVMPYLPSAKEQHDYLMHLDHTSFTPTSRSAGTQMLIPQGYIKWTTVPLGISYYTGYLISDPPFMARNLIRAIRIMTTTCQKLILLAPRWSVTLELFCIPPPFFLPCRRPFAQPRGSITRKERAAFR